MGREHSFKRRNSGSNYNQSDTHNRTYVDMANRSIVDVVSGNSGSGDDIDHERNNHSLGGGGGGGRRTSLASGSGSRSSSCSSFDKYEYNNDDATDGNDIENNNGMHHNDRRASGMSRGSGSQRSFGQSFRGLLPSQFSNSRRSSYKRRNSGRHGTTGGGGGGGNTPHEYDDKFLDVCRLDEARSKLIGKVEEPNMIKLLSHWTGTILNEVIFDFVFWLTLAMYVALRIWIQIGAKNYADTHTETETMELETYESKAKVLDSLPIVGGFLTLFLVFFVNQNHERYYSLHDSTMHIMGRICNLSSLLASSPKLPIERSRRINRYCNAAHVVMYAGLTRYLQEGQLVHNLCRDYALLTYEETQRMEDCGLYKGKASACFELLTWALMDVNRALHANMIDQHQASEMRQHIVDFRSMVAQIVVTCLCPIPFFYVHFLSLLTAIYLPLFALMVAFKTGSHAENVPWYAEVVGFFLILLQCLFVVGLRILGQQLGNPYGEDFIDIQITTYIIMVLSTSNRILECTEVNDIDGDVDPDTELELKLQMVNLGDAWGIKQSKSTSTNSTSAASSAANALLNSQQPSNTKTAPTASPSPSQSRSSSSRSFHVPLSSSTTNQQPQQHRYNNTKHDADDDHAMDVTNDDLESDNYHSYNYNDDTEEEEDQQQQEELSLAPPPTTMTPPPPSSELRQRSNSNVGATSSSNTKTNKFLCKIKRLRHEAKEELTKKKAPSRTIPLSYSMHRCIPPTDEK